MADQSLTDLLRSGVTVTHTKDGYVVTPATPLEPAVGEFVAEWEVARTFTFPYPDEAGDA